MKLETWIPLESSMIIPDEVKFINCDTRDFNLSAWTEYPDRKHFKGESDDFICKHQIIPQLNKLKEETGGDGEWRHIELKNGSWLKYIWFMRIEDDKFIMATQEGQILNHETLFDMIDWSNPYIKTE